MPKTFQVPVWFNVQAETQEEAWMIIANMTVNPLTLKAWDFTVEEPVEITETEEN